MPKKTKGESLTGRTHRFSLQITPEANEAIRLEAFRKRVSMNAICAAWVEDRARRVPKQKESEK